MHSYRLIPETGPNAPWLLEWDEKLFFLQDPDGQRVIEVETSLAHRVIDLSRAFVDGTICIVGAQEPFCFKQNDTAQYNLQRLVETGLRSDPEYRAAMHRQSARSMVGGAAMFLIAGGLLGCYCWYASWAPDPPEGSWIRFFGWLIKGILAV
jgi:hypothetical protein